MAGKSAGAKNWAPGSPTTRYNASGKNKEFYTFENAPGIGAYATGGTIIDGGDGYIYHIFAGDGTFTVNRPPAVIDNVDYLIVAGGGAGPAATGAAPRNGGGGGGGFRSGNIPVSTGSYPIVVGAGGPSAPSFAPSRSGSPSSAFGLTATGGGSGTVYSFPATTAPGGGGSGGGGADTSGGPSVAPTDGQRPGGLGNSPPTIPRQGYPGGNGAPWTAPIGASAGGGGAGGVGSNWVSGTSGTLGGPGRIEPNFPPTIVSRAIPAPVLPTWQPLIVPGGYSAGGPGNPFPSPRTTPANSGYGGNPGGSSGGSGIVCIRYKKTSGYSRATGGTIEPNTHPEHPGVWRHIFTSPGNFTITDPTLQWVDYLAVGGGGAGGGGNINPGIAGAGGGGGAGGFVSSIHTSTTTPTSIPQAYPWNPGYSVQVGEQMPVSVGTYPIGIGTGGISTNSPRDGSATTIGSPGASQIIAAGGGGGASVPGTGGSGGSGGGSSTIGPPITGGAASPSPNIQGNTGANGTSSPVIRNAGGGGGAGAQGSNGLIPPVAPYPGAAGGAGWYSVLSPSTYGTPGPLTPTAQYRYFAGGGGSGGSYRTDQTTSAAPGGAGGAGGGGNGGAPPSSPGTSAATPGTTNTGGGGGGAGSAGGDGGPGIVIIQYPE